jgi:hypothetical protein
MARVNVWVPDGLLEQLRERCPGAVMSRLVQDAVRAALGCEHAAGWTCAVCGVPVDRLEVERTAKADLWRAISARLEGTPPTSVVGAHKLMRDEAIRQGVASAAFSPEWRLPRHRRSA